MIELKKSVRDLKPYFVNEIAYKVKMDANEGKNYLIDENLIIEGFQANIYPDSDSQLLRENMASFYSVKKENIMVGNGSSEMITTVINGFCEPGEKVMGFVPSFSMYDVYCKLACAEYVKLKSNEDFSFDLDYLVERAQEEKPKVIIICNPNNPTGNYIEKEDIIKTLDRLKDTVVILDEAYIDFGGESCVDKINDYENLIVMRTLSKAFGLASIRMGCLIANSAMVNQMWKIKVPYNINTLTQYVANKAFEKVEKVKEFTNMMAGLRDELSANLAELGIKTYPSKSNFILIYSDVEDLFEKLNERGVLIRKFKGDMEGYYRISVGYKEENEILLKELEDII
jgi:histidinol-phosphate aminotransferase